MTAVRLFTSRVDETSKRMERGWGSISFLPPAGVIEVDQGSDAVPSSQGRVWEDLTERIRRRFR